MSWTNVVKEFLAKAAANADPEISFKFENPKSPLFVTRDKDGKSRTNMGVVIRLSADAPGDSDYTIATVGNTVAGGNFSGLSEESTPDSEESSEASKPSKP